ncbi:MAG: ATP-binding protein, partial [Bacteroidota bacterium]
DRGPGIAPEQMKHLFEPFHTTKLGGTGLGLALSKQIMDKHRAEIRIEPAVGGGTIARLIFSVHQFNNGDK